MAVNRRRPPAAALRYVAEDGHTGYAEAADRLVAALRGSGVGVEYLALTDWVHGADVATVPSGRDEAPGRTARSGAPTVAHLVPEHYPRLRSVVPPGPLVGHTVWETAALPAHWPDLLAVVDRLVVPTEWNRQIFREGGVTTPVAVVPHVIDDVDGDSVDLGLDLRNDDVVFSTIGRWSQRKAPDLTVRAFLAAFTHRDPVVLVVKSDPVVEYSIVPGGGPRGRIRASPGFEIAHLLRGHPDPPRMHLAVDRWSAERVRALHRRADCFVSLTHGEGWGVGLFDALTHGGAVVTTGWGAPVEWMGPEADGLVGFELVPVHHVATASYSPDQHWAEPDLDHAVELLRAVARDPAAAKDRAARTRDHVREAFAPAVVADHFGHVVLDGVGPGPA